ncbi:general secretion pathway protein GspK [Rhodomicrobium lacus]|uniref:general secretion pathway protein GspK n=1 Tax=Rhodomicrobium lacus TaxID=2498452 RepID=UPI000F8F76B7|nr:general secretion pathway protein GspK [Rhodomicrobium lacus]
MIRAKTGAVKDTEEGAALVAVIFVLIFATALTGSLLRLLRSDLQVVDNYEKHFTDELAAEAGIASAIARLADREAVSSVIGQDIFYQSGNREVRVTIENEAGKINLNQTSNPLLGRLLEAICPLAPSNLQFIGAIEHAVDDARGTNRPFLTVSQLFRLPGATSSVVEAIKPYVSVYSFRQIPDFDAAPARLRALMSDGERGAALPLEQNRNSSKAISIGIFTISAFSGQSAPIEVVVYITGDLSRPYQILEWRNRASTEGVRCTD